MGYAPLEKEPVALLLDGIYICFSAGQRELEIILEIF
jgi:hypothetical protein